MSRRKNSNEPFKDEYDPVAVAIGRRIQERRHELRRRDGGGWTQDVIADRMGITRSGYHHWEAGRNRVSTTDLARLAEALETTPDYLLGTERDLTEKQYELTRYYADLPDAHKEALVAFAESLHRQFGHRGGAGC